MVCRSLQERKNLPGGFLFLKVNRNQCLPITALYTVMRKAGVISACNDIFLRILRPVPAAGFILLPVQTAVFTAVY